MPDVLRYLRVAACAVVIACGHTTEREHVDFERMRIQQRYDLFGSSNVFANGQEMQAPPPGTISRETSGDTGAVGTGTTGGLAVTSIPIPITREQLEVGGKNFTIYCAVCHGAAGYGGSIVAENMGPPRPPSLRSARLAAAPPGYLFAVATHGLGRMPSYAQPLTSIERWEVVAYLQRLQHTPDTSYEATDDSVRAAVMRHADSVARARREP